MPERDHTMLKRLLDRLLATRARRDREVRFSDSWRAADDELHAIERAIFRAPVEPSPEDATPMTRCTPFRVRRNARHAPVSGSITPGNAPAS